MIEDIQEALDSDKSVEARRAEINRRYDRKNPDRQLRLNRIAVTRVAVLERYFALRYGRVLPDDDAGREDLVILLNHIAQNPVDPDGKMRASIHCWARWMDHDESHDLVERIAANPRRYRASTIGKLLRLTEEEHAFLGAETIWAFTWTDEKMAEEDKRRRRKRKRTARAAKSSGRPRGRPKSEGMPAWQAAGASSKAAHYRNLKKAAASETQNASPYKRDSYAGTELKSHISVPPDPAPVREPIILPPAPIEKRRAPKRDGARHRQFEDHPELARSALAALALNKSKTERKPRP